MSKRRTERDQQRAKKKAAKRAAMYQPGGSSVYARKRKGDYPPNSPYRTIWAQYA